MDPEAVQVSLPAGAAEPDWEALRAEVLGLDAGTRVVLDASAVEAPEPLATARLLGLVAEARAAGLALGLAGAGTGLRRALAGVPPEVLATPPRPTHRSPLEALGHSTLEAIQVARGLLELLRDTLRGLVPFGRRGIKWDLVVQQMAQVGARATPIVVFISFLVGLVLALNGALQLRQFGAAIFIANLVAISMTREMGPLLTAVIVSGRTGSAIAAEIGTMVVSEEVDALRTMALSPARFLVVPKMVALALMMPLLTVLSIAAGIFGGYLIGVMSLDLPSTSYMSQTVKSLFVSDVLAGLIKSVAFACLITLVGAYRGFGVEGGPEGVGRATTSAVVTAIILCIMTNAGFTAFFYWIG